LRIEDRYIPFIFLPSILDLRFSIFDPRLFVTVFICSGSCDFWRQLRRDVGWGDSFGGSKSIR